MRANARRLRQYGLPLGLFVVLYVGLLLPAMSPVASAYAILDNLTVLGLATLGVAFCMIAREIDLSVGSTVAVSGLLAIKLSAFGAPTSILLTTIIAGAYGAFQGFLIHRLRIDSIVLTLGTLILLRGVAYLFTDSALRLDDPADGDVFLTRVGGVFTVASIIAVVAYLVLGGVLRYTKPGREVYAFGGARSEAIAAGVNGRRVLITVFCVSGLCAGLAGSVSAYQSASANPTSYGDLLFAVFSAALLGGVSLKGGRGSAINVFLGVGVMGCITAAFSIRGSSYYEAQLTTGVILFAVVTIDWLLARRWASALARRRLELRHTWSGDSSTTSGRLTI
ncbi:ABC transporter permease [Pseudonocardia ailaonensis]|uniref:ABC transporter permease n=1 Tax=Pseudonocardia ailaonensis TaxID=367279 RepID=A0ABN2NJ99_9PSEU